MLIFYGESGELARGDRFGEIFLQRSEAQYVTNTDYTYMLIIEFTGAGALATHRSEERNVLLDPGHGRHGDPLWRLVSDVLHLEGRCLLTSSSV